MRGVQPLLRGGEMLQQGAALAVETNAFHDHAGQKSENCQIQTAGGYEKSELAAAHHPTTLAGGVDSRRFTWPTLAPRDDRSCSDSRTMNRKELRGLSGLKRS